MAAQLIVSSIPRRARFAGRGALGVLLLSTVSLAGVAMLGCADTFTSTRSETTIGQTLYAEGDTEEATMIFANQVRRAPKNYKAHYHLGQARLASGRSGEAIRSFKTGLEVMPLTQHGQDDREYRFKLVDALSGALAEHDADGSQLAQIERKSKGDKWMKLLVAMTYAKAGQPDHAIQSFTEATTLDRDDPEIAKQYGLYLESIAQAEPAERQLRRAYRLNTQDEQVAAALRRLGIVPGPAILSATELSKPALPLGPIPEIKVGLKPAAPDPSAQANQQAAPVETVPAKPTKTLN